MLKLKDIFNIDISSKGGGKLYKKIMRKYNIPLKDVKEVKQEIVECSSGSGEGVKEYYYKCNHENIPYKDKTLFDVLKYCCILTGIIDNLGFCYNKNIDRNKNLDPLEDRFWENYDYGSNIIAFSILDREILSYYYEKVVYSSKGDLYSKCKEFLPQTAPPDVSQDVINAAVEMFKTMYQEITKEEYESMITYKP